MERNTRLHRAIHTYARNTVGLGWEIVPSAEVTETTNRVVEGELLHYLDREAV